MVSNLYFFIFDPIQSLNITLIDRQRPQHSGEVHLQQKININLTPHHPVLKLDPELGGEITTANFWAQSQLSDEQSAAGLLPEFKIMLFHPSFSN